MTANFLTRALARTMAALVVMAIAAACGEDVDFNGSTASDAAPKEAAAFDSGMIDARADATQASDASPCSSDAASGSCRSNGEPCHDANDCCSMRCQAAGSNEAYCLPPGTCSPPGAECQSRSSCCSGRCEPGGPRGSLECGLFCAANGSPCDDAQQCCSLACNSGVCGETPICGVLGSPCGANGGCCSGRCNSGHCAMNAEPCFPSGEECGTDSGTYCCSGVCDGLTGRCDLGPGSCREAWTPCITDSDCCRGTCSPDSQGIPVCMAPCLPSGQDCNSNGDCCGGTCGGVPSTCRACP